MPRLRVLLTVLPIAAVLTAGTLLFACGAKSQKAVKESYGEIKSYLSKEPDWYSSNEAITLANDILLCQLPDGGWRKDWTNFSVEGSWAKSTIDNDGTTTEISILAKVYNATGVKKYKKACLKGVDLLLKSQYDNGGWPQVFDDHGTYHAHITYNDYAMVHVMNLLTQVSTKTGDFAFVDSKRQDKAAEAVEKGIKCILDTQIKVHGVKTAWCQQYDENTLEPTSGRAYELPSISAAESVGIVEYLKSIPEPTEQIVEAVNCALEWYETSKLEGIKFVTQGDDKVVIEDPDAEPIWARFYKIETNEPIFVDRDGIIRYDVSEISKERRTGYAWYGNWPKKILEAGPIHMPV